MRQVHAGPVHRHSPCPGFGNRLSKVVSTIERPLACICVCELPSAQLAPVLKFIDTSPCPCLPPSQAVAPVKRVEAEGGSNSLTPSVTGIVKKLGVTIGEGVKLQQSH
jgi:hypothetical protein